MKKILGLFGALLFMTSVYAADMRFVQVSDVRYSSSAANSMLPAVIEDINKQKDVEFVVFTGDNIGKASRSELDAFINAAKKLKCPFYLVIGDKDVNKLKDLSKVDYIKLVSKKVRKFKFETPSYTFEKNGVVFIVADGSKDVIPDTIGYFKEDVLSWLDTQLGLYPNKNVIIFQHFPVIPPSNREGYYTYKPENYLKVIGKHSNVKAVISGHFGVNNEQNVNGVLHISTASLPYYRIIDILDYDTQSPVIWAQLKQIK